MADDILFAVELATPERVLIRGSAAQVILRTADGDITFLRGHTPLVGEVEPGVVRVVAEDGDEQRVAVHGGFVQVEQNVDPDSESEAPARSLSPLSGTRVTVLAGIAELAEEIDIERAQLAHEAAETRVSELTAAGRIGGSGSAGSGSEAVEEVDIEVVEATAALLRAEVRLEVAGATAGSGS